MSGKRLLVTGDMVWGMSDPTTPYVGQIVDQEGAAPSQTAAMEAASVAPKSGGCVMTVNGLPVAHAGCVSVATPPLPQARPLATCPGITLNGKPLLVELGQFMASPSGSLSSTAVTQQSVRISKAVSGATVSEQQQEQLARAMTGGPPVRSSFGDPSAEQLLASRISTTRLADILPPEYAHLVGDPVDVGTGAVVTRQVDDHSPKYGLRFERSYVSRHAGRNGPLGWGWSHTYHQSIWLEVGRVVLEDAGRQIEFDTFDLLDQVARPGAVLRDPTGRLVLTSHGRNAWELFDGESTRYFLPMPGTSSADKDRGLARLSTIARPGLPLVELHYDDQARLSSVRCDGQAIFTLRYAKDGLLDSLNDRVMRYAYSAAGDLIEARDLDGNARLYDYSSHLLVRETNRRGGAFYYGYDGHEPSARCIRTWGDGGRLHRILAYEGGSTLVTDSRGERTAYQVSPLGMVTGIRYADGTSVRYQFDDLLRLVAVGRGRARAVDHYDDEGRRVKHRERDGAIWQMEYDAGGRLVTGTDPVGGHWEFGYDLEGRLTRVLDPEHHVYRMEYAQGRLSKVIDPLGRVIEFSLGAADEILQIRAPWQPDIEFQYDHAGRLTAAMTESGDEAHWYYDAQGQLVGAMRGGELVQWRRDPEGSILQEQSDERLETFDRDAFGRLLRRHGDAVDVTYRYDTEDRCVRAIAEGGPEIALAYDERARVSHYRVDGEEVELRYDPDTEMIAEITGPGGSVALTWDDAGRLVGCEDAQGKRSYGYREDGLLTSFATEHHACTLERNALGVVLQQDYVERKVASPDVDHRGERYGVEVEDGPSIFYLWSSAGALERIGLVGDVPCEIDLEIGRYATRGVARHQDGRTEYATLVGTPGPRAIAAHGVPRDALFRPLQSADGAPMLWDEDRLLCEGEQIHVHALPSGQHLGAVRGEAFVFDHGDAPVVQHDGTDAALAGCCMVPDASRASAFDLTPQAFLGHAFQRRVWNADPRPTPGRLPWNPQAWAPASPQVSIGPTRLDQEALLRWLSPFPAPKLRVFSEA